MPHVLQQRLAKLGRRVRLLLALHCAAWVVGSLLAAVVAAALLDYVVRLQDQGTRLLIWLGIVGLSGYLLYARLLPLWRWRSSPLALAQRVERRYPQLADRLSSSLEFLEQDEHDVYAGSAAMRRAVVHRVTQEVEQLDLNDCLQRRSVARPLGAAMLVLVVAVALYGLNPPAARLALARLANPWSKAQWPQLNHLAFTHPVERLAAGEALELEVIDQAGAALPSEIRFEFRYRDPTGGEEVRTEAVRPLGESALLTVDQVVRSFAYRATGGDDQHMPWTELVVVEPPSPAQLVAHLSYPAYTRWPEATSEPQLRALIGTRFTLRGTSHKPLGKATLVRDDGSEHAGMLSDDGLEFVFSSTDESPLLIEHSGWYSILLEDREGFQGGRHLRYDIQAIDDRPPSVALELPAADTFATPAATLPLRIVAKDDLALQRVAIHWSTSAATQEAEQVLPLYEGPELDSEAVPTATAQPPAAAAATTSAVTTVAASAAVAAGQAGESRTVEHPWQLEPLALQPGVRLTLYATASDYRPQLGQSASRRITIVSAEEFHDRMAQRQQLILGELARILDQERQSRAAVRQLEIQLGEVGSLVQRDLDRLQQADLLQREVERGLGNTSEAVPGQIKQLLADLDANRLDQSETYHNLRRLQDELRRLADKELLDVRRHLTVTTKSAHEALSTDPVPNPTTRPVELSEPLAAAGVAQDGVIRSLQQLLGELSEWDNHRRFQRDLSQLRQSQERLLDDTATTAASTLTTPLRQLNPQQLADLKQLAQRQGDAARSLESLERQLLSMADQLRGKDPAAADAISDAVKQSRAQSLAARMRNTARNLENNQVGEATGTQQQVLAGLDEVLDTLANRRQRTLEGLVKRLRESEQQLAELRKEQEGLRKKLAEAAATPDEAQRRRELERLVAQQRQLQEQTDRLMRQLRRLEAEKAAGALGRSSQAMGQAGQQGEQGAATDAAQQAAQAERDLDDAQHHLAEARRRAEQDLANEQLARLEDTLTAMRGRQEQLLGETTDYEARRQNQGQLTRAALASVADLAHQQALLADETSATGEKLSATAVFELALRSAASAMRSAADQLERRQLGEATQQHQCDAIAALGRLIDALAPPQPEENEAPPEGGAGQGGADQSAQQGQSLRSLAELQLLALMQQDLNTRSRALEEAMRQSGAPTSAQQREYERLAALQGELADLLLDLVSPAEEAAADTTPDDELQKLLQPDLQRSEPTDPAGTRGILPAPRSAAVQLPVTTQLPAAAQVAATALLAASNPLDDELLRGLEGDSPPKKPAPRPADSDADPQQPREENPPAGEKPAANSASDSDDPIARISQQMREIQERMRQLQNDPEVKSQQEQVARDLQILIDQLRRQQQQQQQSSGKNTPSQQQTTARDRPQQQAGDAPAAGDGRPQEGPARESSDRQGPPPDQIDLDALSNEDLLKQVWGRLPERMRQQLLQSANEQFLPAYESLIEEYFRELAKPSPR